MSLYLVTGGAGFIGSNIVEELVRRGERVRVLDNFSTGKRENLALFLDKIELVEGDVRSYYIVHQAMQGVDFVLHEAALPSVSRSVKDPITTNEVNVTGTLHVLEAAREAKVKRFVLASSSSVYGNAKEFPITESTTPQPISPYGVSKLSAERYCLVYQKLHGLKTVILRYFHVFGPRQSADSNYVSVIPKFIERIKQGKPPVIFGDGEQTRDFTYIENAVYATLLACEAEDNICSGRSFNVGSGERHTINKLVADINELLGTQVKPEYELERSGDIKHSQASIEKSKKGIYYMVSKSYREGLKLTVQGQVS